MKYLQTPGENHSVETESLADGNDRANDFDASSAFTRFDAVGTALVVRTLQANELFVAMIKALPFPAFLIDPSGLIRLSNDPAERILRKLQVDGHGPCCGPFQVLFSSHITALEYELLLQAAMSSGKSHIMQGAVRMGRRHMWNRIHIVPVRLGEETWVLLFLEDLTARMKLLLLNRKKYHGILEERLRIRFMEWIEMRKNNNGEALGGIGSEQIPTGDEPRSH